MNNHRLTLFLFSFAVVFFSCRRDKPENPLMPAISIANSGGVYITNEGNFQYGNAKVSYYSITDASVTEDLYKIANGTALGDVCQSMYLFNGKAYIVVNNSGKVAVVNSKTFATITEIQGLGSPRYFLPVSNNKAYVTDLYANSISIVNLSTNSKTGSIPCKGWTEELISVYGKTYITNKQSDKIYIVNEATDLLEDSIQVGYGSNSIREDKDGKLWVLCSGSISNTIKASLHKINPVTKQVEQSFLFASAADSPWRLNINGSNDTLYFMNNNIYRMSISASTLPSTPFITSNGRAFYGLGVDPINGTIYVSDAIDYVQRGMVYRYSSNGALINSFLAGIIPGTFCFN